MSINECDCNFSELAKERLPEYLRKLKAEKKLQMSELSKNGVGHKTILKNMKLADDFSGCYVFYEMDKPIYVGISRTVVKRLVQHVKGKTHFDASLAYRMTKEKFPHKSTRQKAMNEKVFKAEFEGMKKYLSTLQVSFVQINNPVELYLFEVFCSMEFNTSVWNSFETH